MYSGRIYKLECDTGHYYYGSTTQTLAVRLYGHHYTSKSCQSKVYSFINEIGWDRVNMVLVLEYPCENREQLQQKEDEYIRPKLANPLCLNENRAYQTEEELLENIKNYYVENKEYYVENREERIAKMKVYYQENREKKLARQKDYDNKHKDAINARKRAIRLENKQSTS